MSLSHQLQPQRRAAFALRVGLWIAQIVLFIFFGMSGVVKTALSPDAMTGAGIAYATELPLWLLRFIGACELAGAIGIILPALTGIMPRLTALAALGFLTIQILAIGFHTMRGEIAVTWPVNLLLLALSAFVVWGRARRSG